MTLISLVGKLSPPRLYSKKEKEKRNKQNNHQPKSHITINIHPCKPLYPCILIRRVYYLTLERLYYLITTFEKII